jgi:hypothetical protein
MASPTASELAFKKQAEVAREALQAFNLIRPLALSAPGPVKTALFELVTATVSSSLLSFIYETNVSCLFSGRSPSTASLPSISYIHYSKKFRRLSTSLFKTLHRNILISSFRLTPSEFPDSQLGLKTPSCTLRLPRKVRNHFLSLFITFCLRLFYLAATSTAQLRPEKGKKIKGTQPVCLPFISLFISLY